MAKNHAVIIDDTNDGETKERIEKVKSRFDAANQKTFNIIEDFIAGGYEENLARLLVYLPKERRSAALQSLPESVREKVSSILNTFSEKKNSDPDVMSAVGTVLKNADFYGEKAAHEIIQNGDIYFLSAVESESKNLFEVNPLLSMNVEYYLVNMNVLVDIDDRSIQKWLREVETQDLAKALKGTDAEVQEKIFINMSQRAAAMLREDMEFMGPVRKSDVIETQKKLIGILKRLNEEGEIVISKRFGGCIGDELV
jgi:flagellar motor switch protein FliG